MKKSFVLAGLLLSGFAMAEVTDVPNTFVADAPINATDMNNNFSHVIQQITNVDSALDTRVSALESSVPSSPSLAQLQGFTTATTAGGAGVFGMIALCQAEFTESRICSTDEVAKTTSLPALPSGTFAWLLPVIGNSYNGFVELVSGDTNSNPQNYTCKGWLTSSNAYAGMTVSDIGAMDTATCDVLRPVACCK